MENKNNKYDKNYNKKEFNNYNKYESVKKETEIEESVEDIVEDSIVKTEVLENTEIKDNEVVEENIKESKNDDQMSEKELIDLINEKSKYLADNKSKLSPIEYQKLVDTIDNLKKLLNKYKLNKVKAVPVTSAPLVKNRPKTKSSRYTNNMLLL